MEIEDEDGSTIKLIRDGSENVFGRGSGFNTKDTTVSRLHILFQLRITENQTEPRVSFQVIGKNPLWLRSDGESKIKIFKKLEEGEMAHGDWFCISSQTPVWFSLKRIEVGEEKDLEHEGGSDVKTIDVSQIDPVKEFGFLVIGHEFDCYPKQRIRSAKNWDWFLAETKQESEDDDGDDENKRKRRRKRKKGEGYDEDDEWTGESEEDKETVAKTKKVVVRSKYLTRFKDKNRPRKDKERKADSLRRKTADDEEDDTLGGFIVNGNEEGDVDEEQEGEGDEEEEFIDDDDEEELDD